MKINSQDEVAVAFLAEALTQADPNSIAWKNLPWNERTKRVEQTRKALNKIETEIRVRELEEQKRQAEEDRARANVIRLQTTIQNCSSEIAAIESSLMEKHEIRRLSKLELIRAEFDLKTIREKKNA